MEEKDLKTIGEQAVTKKKKSLRPASLELNCTATKQEISEILGNTFYWYKREKVKSDEECAERLNEFFDRVIKTGEVPTVEKMCLSLGVTRMAVWNWENGLDGASAARALMIKRAKEMLAAMDAELVSKWKIPQVTYMFRAKNFYGMVDKQDVVISSNNALGEQKDVAELEQKYKDSIVLDGDDVDVK